MSDLNGTPVRLKQQNQSVVLYVGEYAVLVLRPHEPATLIPHVGLSTPLELDGWGRMVVDKYGGNDDK